LNCADFNGRRSSTRSAQRGKVYGPGSPGGSQKCVKRPISAQNGRARAAWRDLHPLEPDSPSGTTWIAASRTSSRKRFSVDPRARISQRVLLRRNASRSTALICPGASRAARSVKRRWARCRTPCGTGVHRHAVERTGLEAVNDRRCSATTSAAAAGPGPAARPGPATGPVAAGTGRRPAAGAARVAGALGAVGARRRIAVHLAGRR